MTANLRFASVVALAIWCASSATQPLGARAQVGVVRLPDAGIQPQVAVDAKGALHVIYFKGEAAHGDLFYTRLQPDNTLSKPIQVNAHTGSAIATGTMRGGHLAVGKNGRVHVAWHGSDRALPRAPGEATPVLYSRLNAAATAFEPERNIVQRSVLGLDGGTVAADLAGNVYVMWHAFEPGKRGEADRRVWVARSTDDGGTFSKEEPASEAATGTCGCCGIGAMADRRGVLFALYRSATDTVHRDTYLLTSRDHAKTFTSVKLQEWNVGACPMSTSSLTETADGLLAAWETDGRVQWTSIRSTAGQSSGIVTPDGSTRNRKHPAIAANSRGDILLVWTEGTGWSKGGGLAWQVFDRNGRPITQQEREAGVPTWGLAAAGARPDGSFVIIY